MINSTGQLHFRGISSEAVGFVSFGGVAWFYPDLQVYRLHLQPCKVLSLGMQSHNGD